MKSKSKYLALLHRTSSLKTVLLTDRGYLSTRESLAPSIETQPVCTFLNPNVHSFKPKKVAVDLSKISREKNRKSFQGGTVKRILGNTDQGSVFLRNKDWLDERKRKLDELKVREAEKELNGCTFTPSISRLTIASPTGIKTNPLRRDNSYTSIYRDKLLYNAFNKYKF